MHAPRSHTSTLPRNDMIDDELLTVVAVPAMTAKRWCSDFWQFRIHRSISAKSDMNYRSRSLRSLRSRQHLTHSPGEHLTTMGTFSPFFCMGAMRHVLRDMRATRLCRRYAIVGIHAAKWTCVMRAHRLIYIHLGNTNEPVKWAKSIPSTSKITTKFVYFYSSSSCLRHSVDSRADRRLLRCCFSSQKGTNRKHF